MKPTFFGSGAWMNIFSIIFSSFDVEEKKKLLFQCVRHLPCSTCSIHSQNHLQESGFFELESCSEILRCFVNLRNRFYPEIDLSELTENTFTDYKDVVLKKVIYRC